MSVILTERAINRVKTFLSKRGHGAGLRLGVRTTGCSGLAYVLEYADAIEPGDHVFEEQGIKVVISDKSLPYIDGSKLDFVREGLNEGFKFSNPNVKDECGCGESFSI